jgi:signal transduction histidine kinase
MRSDKSRLARMSENMLARYGLAVAALAAALLMGRALHPFAVAYAPDLILLLAVIFAGWYCGVGPSMLTLVLALAAARYWFTSPSHSFRIPAAAEGIGLLVFLFASGTAVAMGEARRLDNEKLHRARRDLEDRVQERTAELDIANRSLRELSARLLQSQDDERRRIARELHDSVGQMLAALTMNLSAVRADIERVTRTATTLADSEGLVQQMSTEVRTISHLLHPPLLDEAGLSSAVRWYLDGFAQRSKLKVDLDLPSDFGRLSRELETAIFRVVQECLTNIHRHSGSAIAKVRLRQRDGEVLVEVEDRGKGIPPEKQDQMATGGTPGVGIRGMRERIRQLGGALEIVSNGTGTVVLARFPVADPQLTAEIPALSSSSSTAAA